MFTWEILLHGGGTHGGASGIACCHHGQNRSYGSLDVLRMFLVCFKDVLRMFLGCVKDVLRML